MSRLASPPTVAPLLLIPRVDVEPQYGVERNVVEHQFADDDLEDGVLGSRYALHEAAEPCARGAETKAASTVLRAFVLVRLVGDLHRRARRAVTHRNQYRLVGVTAEQPVDPRDRQLPGRVGGTDRQDCQALSGNLLTHAIVHGLTEAIALGPSDSSIAISFWEEATH